MKNYQKILIPCLTAFSLLSTAFSTVEKNQPLNTLKEKSDIANYLSTSGGLTCAPAKLLSCERSVTTDEEFAESKIVVALTSKEVINVESIIRNYK
jgi:hypothetical protein